MQEEELIGNFRKLEERIEQTSKMFDQLLEAQGQALRLDYTSGPRYMYLVRQRNREDKTIGVYWRVYRHVGGKQGRVWKHGWHVKKVPPSALSKLDDRTRFQEINDTAKAIYIVREDLVRKKRSIEATLQNFQREANGSDSRMSRAEQFLDQFAAEA